MWKRIKCSSTESIELKVRNLSIRKLFSVKERYDTFYFPMVGKFLKFEGGSSVICMIFFFNFKALGILLLVKTRIRLSSRKLWTRENHRLIHKNSFSNGISYSTHNTGRFVTGDTNVYRVIVREKIRRKCKIKLFHGFRFRERQVRKLNLSNFAPNKSTINNRQ